MKRTTAILISTIVTALLVVTVLAVSAAKSDTGTAQAASQSATTTATDTNVDLAAQPQQFDQSVTFDQHEQFEHEHEGGEHSRSGSFGGFGDD